MGFWRRSVYKRHDGISVAGQKGVFHMALRNLAAVFCVVALGCSRSVDLKRSFVGQQSRTQNSLFVFATDFTTGSIQKVDLTSASVGPASFPASADAVIRFDYEAGNLLVLNRLASNHLRASSADLARVLFEIPFEPNSNPQDIAFLGNGEAYVGFYHGAELKRFDLKSKQQTGSVNLARWSDDDGYPEVASLKRLSSGLVLASLQRLDLNTYQPTGSSFVLLVDPATNKVIEQRQLARANPFSSVKEWNGAVYLGEAGVLDRRTPQLDGAIEKLDAVNLESLGIVIEEAELGGDVLDFEILDANHGVAIVAMPESAVVLFDPTSGRKTRTLESPSGFRFSQVLVDRERSVFFVTDRDLQNPGIRVYDFSGVEKKDHRIGLKLPPMSMVLAP